MEGLPLQSEDVFKTKYADLFNKDSEKVLEILNNKYQEIYNYNNESRNTELSEYDLADVFKFFIMRELEVGKGPTGMKQNAISFFVEKMDSLKEKDKLAPKPLKCPHIEVDEEMMRRMIAGLVPMDSPAVIPI